jgi:hypothetical protein
MMFLMLGLSERHRAPAWQDVGLKKSRRVVGFRFVLVSSRLCAESLTRPRDNDRSTYNPVETAVVTESSQR